MEDQLYELLRQCTLQIGKSGREKLGTGFFVAPGLILTCAHVIQNVEQGSIEAVWNGQAYPAQVIKNEPGPDLALLSIVLKEHPCVWLKEGASPFDDLYTYGYPDEYSGGDAATFELEGVSRDRRELLKFKTGQVRPGLSGAPLLNTRTGYVCGVVRLTRDRGTDLGGRAIPVATVLHIFPELMPLQQQFHEHDTRWRSLLFSAWNAKAQALKSRYIDQTDYVQDRLQRFVGRETELGILRERIAGKREGGGYVLFTGDVGQGKSSIIARMIAAQGRDSCAYHFIQPGSGANYAMNLLRNLMARLIVKYDLPEYFIAGESYQILCSNFLGVVKAIAGQGKQEIIYIDGLDQLDAESSAGPDLNFLPSQLPPGIVMVIGARPNTLFDQLLLLTRTRQNDVYELPGLSSSDFQLLLQHHQVTLPEVLSDRLNQGLKQNPLYLDLVAQELRAASGLQIEELIARVASNPDDIFTITFTRIRGMQRSVDDWYEVIRPILGILLAAQEPLAVQQIARIMKRNEGRINEGIRQLGGLLTLLAGQRYTLFHPKLHEYLQLGEGGPGAGIQFSPTEVQTLHDQVARWCEQEPLELLWSEPSSASSRDGYREYAQKHYITHLYEARDYPRLFAILDERSYERGKLRFDPSTRSSMMDLKLGCQAAAQEARTLEEGKRLLVRLWRYTLLRATLTTRADAYPVEAFQALLALGREQEALNLAELLTQPSSKLAVLLVITEYLLKDASRETEGMQLLSRVYEIGMSTEDNAIKTAALGGLTDVLIHTTRLEQAEKSTKEIPDEYIKAAFYTTISEAYGKQADWGQAEEVARLIAADEIRVGAFSQLAVKLKEAGEAVKAEELWEEAAALASAFTDNAKYNSAMYDLCVSFMQVQDWKVSNALARSMGNSAEKIGALSQLARFLTQAGAQAETAWEEAKTAIVNVGEQERDAAYSKYATALARAGRYVEAETTASRYLAGNPTERIAVFSEIASSLIRNDEWMQSKRIINPIIKEYDLTDVEPSRLNSILIGICIDLSQRSQWDQARDVALSIPDKEARCRAMMSIVKQLASAGVSQRAQSAWEEASAMCVAQTDTVQARIAITLVVALAHAGQIAQARHIISALPEKQAQEHCLEELAIALAHVGQVKEAEEIASNVTSTERKDHVQRILAVAQLKHEQFEQALVTARTISSTEQQAHALVNLVSACCEMKQWKRAQEIERLISPLHSLEEARRHIIVALVGNDRLEEAEELINAIKTNTYYKEEAWSAFITAVAQEYIGIDLARKYLRKIKKNNRIKQKTSCNIDLASLMMWTYAASNAYDIEAGPERDEALYNVARTFAYNNMRDEAEKLAQEIGGEQKRDEAWATIAKAYAQEGQWTRVIAALDRVQKRRQRASVLQKWGTLLAQPADRGEREQIVQRLPKSEEKADVLISAADTLVQANRYLEQIHLSQQTWLQAVTKDDCEYYFAVVRGLLSHNPELCNEFFECFAWVASLLIR